MSIGVAIIGGGIFAREEHVPAVKASKHLTLKAVYSRSLKSAKTLKTDDSVDIYSEDSDQGKGKGYDALLSRSDIQAVILCLTIPVTPDFIKRSILAGKHVLSEKPIAKDIATAQELINFVKENGKGKTWTVAENFRYLDSYTFAHEKRQKLGRILNFSMKHHMMVELGSKYIETEWRKKPDYQGGFLLDGGIHDIAAMRHILGKDDPIVRLSAFTKQNQEHLPPVDTIDGIFRLKSGATGTVSQSFGTTFPSYSEWAFACEKGTVTLSRTAEVNSDQDQDQLAPNVVVVTGPDGKEISRDEVKDERSGVPPEIRAWGEALAEGKVNEKQRAEEGLADLELTEKLLKSGEQDGAPQQVTLQI